MNNMTYLLLDVQNMNYISCINNLNDVLKTFDLTSQSVNLLSHLKQKLSLMNQQSNKMLLLKNLMNMGLQLMCCKKHVY